MTTKPRTLKFRKPAISSSIRRRAASQLAALEKSRAVNATVFAFSGKCPSTRLGNPSGQNNPTE